MSNFEVLQEYEKYGIPLPKLEELQTLKEENKKLKEFLKKAIFLIKRNIAFEDVKKDMKNHKINIETSEEIISLINRMAND